MLRTSQGDFMKKEFAFAALACGASVAFAANTVNPTFLWDGSTDTEGRVITNMIVLALLRLYSLQNSI